jgi:ABC-2 type transport system ATP-binding protein
VDDFAIKVENVGKTFKLPHEKQSSIKSMFINAFRSKKGYELQKALNGVSFEIKKGEFFGIVGRNGSGKSTLLKLLAGIYTPTSGQVHVRGSLTPFIELGVGFSPELTGRENVFLNGALLGFNRNDMQKMYTDIVEFAELERFMDQKLKNYSSGMQVRLAFSIAIRAQSDILLLDEVLAVGDEAFQRKCYDYFESLKREKKTVIIVTHDMAAIERFCDRGILIEGGEVVIDGTAKQIVKGYRRIFEKDQKKQKPKDDIKKRWGDGRLKIASPVTICNKESIEINFKINCVEQIKDSAIVSYTIKNTEGRSLYGERYKSSVLKLLNPGDSTKASIIVKNILGKGDYLIDLSIYAEDSNSYCDFWSDSTSFTVKDGPLNQLNIIAEGKLNLGSNEQ